MEAAEDEEAMTAAAKARGVEVEKVEGDDTRATEGAMLKSFLSLLLLLQQFAAARETAGLVREAREDTDARRGSELLRIERI